MFCAFKCCVSLILKGLFFNFQKNFSLDFVLHWCFSNLALSMNHSKNIFKYQFLDPTFCASDMFRNWKCIFSKKPFSSIMMPDLGIITVIITISTSMGALRL